MKPITRAGYLGEKPDFSQQKLPKQQYTPLLKSSQQLWCLKLELTNTIYYLYNISAL